MLSLVVLPLWAFAASAVWLAIGAFLMQVMVQGAWGVIPVHLNELSPDDARGTFPRFVYQLVNLIASFNATLQAGIAAHYGGNYALALAVVAGDRRICVLTDAPRNFVVSSFLSFANTILSKADIRLRRNICRSGPKSDVQAYCAAPRTCCHQL